jgi:hypothetical protein
MIYKLSQNKLILNSIGINAIKYILKIVKIHCQNTIYNFI